MTDLKSELSSLTEITESLAQATTDLQLAFRDVQRVLADFLVANRGLVTTPDPERVSRSTPNRTRSCTPTVPT